MTDVIMPKMGDGMEEGTLLEWLKKDGEAVKAGEVIGTIQTDKATLELESPGAGTLAGFLIAAGDTVPVGQAIAAILAPGEALPAHWKTAPNAHKAPEKVVEKVSEPGAVAAPDPQPAPTPEPIVACCKGRVLASPLARKIAAERGIDLSTIRGSGPGGRIVEKDLPGSPGAPAPDGHAPIAVPMRFEGGADRQVALSRLRQITAQRTAQSMREVPHFYVTVEVDVERMLAIKDQFEAEEAGKFSINDFVLKACALALRDIPNVNASFNGGSLTEYGRVNVGMAVAIEDGLTVAVIHDADRLPLTMLGARSRDLVARAKQNKLSLEELSGSTFSVSNMGMLDVDNFLAIVNQPNSAILSVSSVRKKVVPNDEDEVEIRRRMNVTCSFDHRVVDGAMGAKFVNVVKTYLEHPTRLLS